MRFGMSNVKRRLTAGYNNLLIRLPLETGITQSVSVRVSTRKNDDEKE